MTRWATVGSPISTRLMPSAAPTAFSDSWQLTGTIATACSPLSPVTSNVLKTWFGSSPSAVGCLQPVAAHRRVVVVLVHGERHAGGFEGPDGGGHDATQARLRRRRRSPSGHTGAMRVAVEPSLRPADYPFTHSLRVRFAETDAMGIVHHSRYLPYLEEARVAYLRHIGHPYTEWREAGLDSAVLEAYVRYRRPLRFDDVVTSTSLSPRRAARRSRWPTWSHGDDEVAATAVTVHGMVTSAGRPTRLPAWLAEMGAS